MGWRGYAVIRATAFAPLGERPGNRYSRLSAGGRAEPRPYTRKAESISRFRRFKSASISRADW